ncbi:HAD-IIB family hydrolase [Halioglobus maricola]|uniref:HAD-IIB family hydrolase n=1 Tax=Halioglobus maricola TaxID=2601894 RepID=A0A5P9NLN6_9GAMM|nr:HAD-IIB family hydrolase [Halioglobus maricola]QFU76731.1 HAD-IIB family hydrolase [Halioglobus maricola]
MTGRLVFTDLDGTLLDHHSYSFAPALPALEQLAQLGVPVIPTTSKTRAEIESIRMALGNEHPFIVENGAAVFIPVGYFSSQPLGTVERDGYWIHERSLSRSHWLEHLAVLSHQYPGQFESFSSAGVDGIVAMTGLSSEAARLANHREYSEPVRWLGSDDNKAEFVARLRQKGANPLQGGRFLSVAGDCDKGRALVWLRQAFAEAWQIEQVADLAAGDSGNDVAMLEAAQTALVIRSPVNDFPELKRTGDVIYSDAFGPAGWAKGVEHWLASTHSAS